MRGQRDRIIFASDWFDAVTAFETVYFWPESAAMFQEFCRVLKPHERTSSSATKRGDTDKDEKWTEIIGGMTIYSGDELKTFLENAGFCNVQIHKNKMGWLCSVTGRSGRRNKECCRKRFWKDCGWGHCWWRSALSASKGRCRHGALYDSKVQERCVALGLTTKEKDQAKLAALQADLRSNLSFYVLLCVYAINGAQTFWGSFWQCFVILSVMNLSSTGLASTAIGSDTPRRG